jgi:ParB family chromosome partitioning protein
MAKHPIEGKRSDVYIADAADLTLVTDPKHPLFDPRVEKPLSAALVTSIKARGVQVPVKVARDGEAFLVVDGRQRVRAVRLANKQLEAEGSTVRIRVPVQITKGDEKNLAGLVLCLNAVREQDDPLVAAGKMARLLDLGYTEAEVAVEAGCDTATVKRAIALLSLPAPVKAHVAAGKLAASAAVKLAGLPREQAVEQAAALVESGHATTEAAARVARAVKAGKVADPHAPAAPGKRTLGKLYRQLADGTDAYTVDAEELLGWILGEKPKAPDEIAGLVRELTSATSAS